MYTLLSVLTINCDKLKLLPVSSYEFLKARICGSLDQHENLLEIKSNFPILETQMYPTSCESFKLIFALDRKL